MTSPQESDSVFVGSVPESYDRFMVPLIFEPYADNLVTRATSAGTAGPVVSQRADAMFDAAVCQFGVMLFPDKVAAHAEVARVLRRGRTFVPALEARSESCRNLAFQTANRHAASRRPLSVTLAAAGLLGSLRSMHWLAPTISTC